MWKYDAQKINAESGCEPASENECNVLWQDRSETFFN